MENHDHENDAAFMARTLELAGLGLGNVSPNPLVGCVILHEDRIIGEGWHEEYGGPHAEVNALRTVRDKELLKNCTVFVNLEPCAHHGKTPPCADLLINHGVKKVTIANRDSNPLVAGRGITKLKDSGIEVITGLLEREGRALNRRFFTFVEKRRPHIILKWAQTSDGFIARQNFDSKWISNTFSRQLVHRWRSEEDAVLVGARTAMVDDPILNVRDWTGRNPKRIVIDRSLSLDRGLHLFDGSQATICYNTRRNEVQQNVALVQLSEEHFIEALVEDLHTRNIQSVLVEGGSVTLGMFLDAGLWDEARVFVSDQAFGAGVRAPVMSGNFEGEESVVNDTLRFYHNRES